MGFGNCWGNLLPASYRNVETVASKKQKMDAFDNEYEAFCANLKAKKAAKEAEENAKKIINTDLETVDTPLPEAVAEEAYQALVKESEVTEDKPKSKKKKKEAEVSEIVEEV